MTLIEAKEKFTNGETFYKLKNYDGNTGNCIEIAYFETREEAREEASDEYPYFFEISKVSIPVKNLGVS